MTTENDYMSSQTNFLSSIPMQNHIMWLHSKPCGFLPIEYDMNVPLILILMRNCSKCIKDTYPSARHLLPQEWLDAR